MAFNLSGVDINQYFATNVAVNITLFTLLVLPPCLLCMLCALALIFTKGINKMIRLVLVNIFAAEICKWIAYTVFYLGWPIRLLYQEDISCKLFFSLLVVASMQPFMAFATYAINVYVFIKYGEKKLKWYVVIPLVTISWVVSITFAVGPYFDELEVFNINGFCTSNPNAILLKGYISATVTLALLFMTIQLICSILTVVYIKRNTLEENTVIKKAIAKVLAYLAVASILSFINNIIPITNPLIRKAIADNDITTIVALNYFLRLVFNVPSIATPIVTIVLLKPVRVAIKAAIKKVCVCCPNNQVHPVNN